MQRSARARSRRTASVLLALVWGALLLVPGTATAAPGPGGAPAAAVVTADRGAHHGAHTPAFRPESRSGPVAHDATADAPHEARLSGHPAHPPALPTAVPAAAAVPLPGGPAGRPVQERAPPPSWYHPRTSRGPPAGPLDV
ncbi:hypothetical protein AB0939_01900 [Streptomyces sp. NPDC006990]|uniref:hypothetical protein n=1 Tax=unclassified Streptomyces TaxID=2593676 RepID=UPI003454F657